MAIPSRLLGSGISPQASVNLCGDVATGLTATGTTNADALALSAVINNVTTTAASTGVKLPPFESGSAVFVANQGANALLVYPPASGQINALTVITGGFSVGAGKSAWFIAVNGTNALSLLGA